MGGTAARQAFGGVLLPAVLLLSCSSKPVSLSEEERTLALTIGFPEAVLLEARRHAVEPVTRLEGTDENFDSVPVDGLAIAVPGDEALEALRALRAALSPQGYLAFRYESNFGNGPDKTSSIRGRNRSPGSPRK